MQHDKRRSGFNLFIALGSLAISIFGFWGFSESLRPMPDQIQRITGIVAKTWFLEHRARYDSSVHFLLRGDGDEFVYGHELPGMDSAQSKMHIGARAEVLYTGAGYPEIWGLTLNGETLLAPKQAYQARRRDGYWGLVLGFGFLISALYMLRVGTRSGVS